MQIFAHLVYLIVQMHCSINKILILCKNLVFFCSSYSSHCQHMRRIVLPELSRMQNPARHYPELMFTLKELQTEQLLTLMETIPLVSQMPKFWYSLLWDIRIKK